MLFADLLSLHLVTLLFFNLVHVTFFSSRCMLALKFAIYLQNSKSPHTSFLCSIGWRIIGFFKHSPHTNSISNSAVLHNNYISLLSDLCACIHMKKKWCRKGSHSSSVSSSNRLMWLQTCKKAMGWCTAQWKMLSFVRKPSWKSNANLN